MPGKGDIPRHTRINLDMSGQNRTKETIMGNLYEVDNPTKSVEAGDWDKWGKWYTTGNVVTFAVLVPRIGTFVAYQDKQYVIMATTTYQEDSGQSHKAIEYPKVDITTKCQILRIDDEGEDLGEEPIWVDSTEITEI
jgi:hypothetical protein